MIPVVYAALMFTVVVLGCKLSYYLDKSHVGLWHRNWCSKMKVKGQCYLSSIEAGIADSIDTSLSISMIRFSLQICCGSPYHR